MVEWLEALTCNQEVPGSSLLSDHWMDLFTVDGFVSQIYSVRNQHFSAKYLNKVIYCFFLYFLSQT